MSALRSIGVTITARGIVRTKSAIPTIHPSLADLTAGLRYHRNRKSRSKWACFVIRAAFIDICPELNSAAWDEILTAVWDASGVTPP